MKRGAQPVYTPVRPKKEMLMDARVYELLNDQINKELYSSYLYLSFADYYEEEGLEALPTGTRSRPRKNATMLLSSATTCTRTVAR